MFYLSKVLKYVKARQYENGNSYILVVLGHAFFYSEYVVPAIVTHDLY